MMTIETRTAIEPQDVLSVEIECCVCGARVTRKVADYRAAPFGCTNCGASWDYQSEEFKSLGVLLKYLKSFADRQTKAGVPFTLRFEIAPHREAL